MIGILLLLIFQATAPRAGISGSVVDVGTPYLQPLFDARVELIRPSGSPIISRTDANGRFAFSELSAGRYRVSVTRDGYQRKSATVELATGQQRNNVLVAMDLAPTLFGHIRDPLNIPIANVLVEAIKVVYGPRGDRSVESVESALTDDLGEYHLYWLDPGDYYLRASSLDLKPGTSVPDNPSPETALPSYAPTYFPGSRDSREAAPIRLRVGSNLSAFDFRLQTRSPISMKGHVYIEATGESVGGAIVVTHAGAVASVEKYEGRAVSPGPNVPSRVVGEFTVGGMPPGTFIVSAQSSEGGQLRTFRRKVTIKAPELAFIIKLSPGTSVAGSVNAPSGPALDLRSIRVSLESVDSDLPSPKAVSMNTNGQFEFIRVEPGEYLIGISNLPGNIYMRSTQSGDLDISSKPLVVEYAQPDSIRITLGADGGMLDGTVLDGANRPFAGADVVLVPDAARRNSPSQYRATASEVDGHFTLRGIPPGDYKMFAWESIEANAYLNDVYMSGYERFGVPITIEPNAIGSTSVRLIPMD